MKAKIVIASVSRSSASGYAKYNGEDFTFMVYRPSKEKLRAMIADAKGWIAADSPHPLRVPIVKAAGPLMNKAPA